MSNIVDFFTDIDQRWVYLAFAVILIIPLWIFYRGK